LKIEKCGPIPALPAIGFFIGRFDCLAGTRWKCRFFAGWH